MNATTLLEHAKQAVEQAIAFTSDVHDVLIACDGEGKPTNYYKLDDMSKVKGLVPLSPWSCVISEAWTLEGKVEDGLPTGSIRNHPDRKENVILSVHKGGNALAISCLPIERKSDKVTIVGEWQDLPMDCLETPSTSCYNIQTS